MQNWWLHHCLPSNATCLQHNNIGTVKNAQNFQKSRCSKFHTEDPLGIRQNHAQCIHQGNLAHGIHTTPQCSYYLWCVIHYHTRNMGVHGSTPDGGDNCLTWLLCHSETATSINLIALLLNSICHPAHYTVLQYSEFWSQITSPWL